jgi:hypothetical protein
MSGKRILSDTQVDEACAMRERGLSCQQISNHFAAAGVKVSAGSISWACLTRGADIPPARRGAKQSLRAGETYSRNGHVIRTFTPDEDTLLRVLDMQGFSLAVIARRLGRRHNSIRGRLATLARHDARREDQARA